MRFIPWQRLILWWSQTVYRLQPRFPAAISTSQAWWCLMNWLIMHPSVVGSRCKQDNCELDFGRCASSFTVQTSSMCVQQSGLHKLWISLFGQWDCRPFTPQFYSPDIQPWLGSLCHAHQHYPKEEWVFQTDSWLSTHKPIYSMPKIKQEGSDSVAEQILPGDILMSIDYEKWFHYIHVLPQHHKYLCFSWHGHFFHWTVLPFGVKSAPYMFSKVIKETVTSCRCPDPYRCIRNRMGSMDSGCQHLWNVGDPCGPSTQEFQGAAGSTLGSAEHAHFSSALQSACVGSVRQHHHSSLHQSSIGIQSSDAQTDHNYFQLVPQSWPSVVLQTSQWSSKLPSRLPIKSAVLSWVDTQSSSVCLSGQDLGSPQCRQIYQRKYNSTPQIQCVVSQQVFKSHRCFVSGLVKRCELDQSLIQSVASSFVQNLARWCQSYSDCGRGLHGTTNWWTSQWFPPSGCQEFKDFVFARLECQRF